MIRFDVTEYCYVNYNNCVEIPDNIIKEYLEECKSKGLSADETRNKLRDYLDDIKWDHVSDREKTDEDYEDCDIDEDTFNEAVDEAMEWYEEPSKKFIGDFGND